MSIFVRVLLLSPMENLYLELSENEFDYCEIEGDSKKGDRWN